MPIATEIQRLQGIKSEIMAALERKSVDTTGKNMSDVGDLIRSISGGSDDFLFLTYFNNFDAINRIDHPIVGNDYSITSSLGPSNASITFNEITYPAVSLYNTIDNTYYVDMLPPLEDGKVYSAELIFKSRASNFNYASLAADSFAYERGYSGNCRGYWLDNWVTFDVNNMMGVTTWSTWTGWKFTERQVDVPFHAAFVYDFVNYKMRGYIDGALAFIGNFPYSRYEAAKKARFGAYYDPLLLTQIALREGDLAINDGENFPVPIKPYRDF